MLSKILSVTGRPGLYKLISTNKNLNIIESLSDGKRIPIYAQEKVIALSDVSIYTNEGDTPLRDVFKAIQKKEEGEKVALGAKTPGKELFAYLEGVLPNYSKESVYASDVKKIISWYNLLTEHGIDLEEDRSDEEAPTSEENEVGLQNNEAKELDNRTTETK